MNPMNKQLDSCVSVFPKFLNKAGVELEAEILASLGFQQADLMIREGYSVHAKSKEEEFNQAAAAYRSSEIDLHSSIIDLNEPDQAMARNLGFCSQIGITSIKIAPFPYEHGRYLPSLDQARSKLEGLQTLSEKSGVQILIQLHGFSIHPSASAGRRLVDGFDPKHIAIYWDPGNMIHQDGYERWAMGLDILGPYLAYVGVKNAAWIKSDDAKVKWKTDFTMLHEGIVDWPDVIDILRQHGYKGKYSLHNFYATDWEPATLGMIKRDLDYLSSLLTPSIS